MPSRTGTLKTKVRVSCGRRPPIIHLVFLTSSSGRNTVWNFTSSVFMNVGGVDTPLHPQFFRAVAFESDDEVPWLFFWRCLRFSSLTVWRTLLFGKRDRYHGVSRLWRCLSFFVDVSIPQFPQRTVEQTVDRSVCGVVRSDRGRAHSPDSSSCFGAGRRTDRRSGSAPDLRVQALPTVAHRPSESVLLRLTELFHPLSSSWYFFHPGTGRTPVLTGLDGHYPFFMLHKRRCYFRCENSRQSILDAWTCLDFCEHVQARRVCLLCHGSASCVHVKRRWRPIRAQQACIQGVQASCLRSTPSFPNGQFQHHHS